MNKKEEILRRMLAEGIDPEDFERWLHAQNQLRLFDNKKDSYGNRENSKVYYCYQSGRECSQYSANEPLIGMRVSSLRISLNFGFSLLSEEAQIFAKENSGHLLDAQDATILSKHVEDIKLALKKAELRELDANFIWTAESSLLRDMCLRRLRDASICLIAAENLDSRGTTILKY